MHFNIDSREAAVLEPTQGLRPGGFLILGILNPFSLWTLKRIARGCFRPSFWRKVNFPGTKSL